VEKDLPYCLKCGAKLKEDDKFCYACGTPVAKVVREEFAVSSDNLICEKMFYMINICLF